MSIIIGILYVILVVTCLFLGLLILVQLPKKDAGAGMAFGGGAGEALFGAGSGNVLTKLTKYSATTFLVLALLLSVIVSKAAKSESSAIDEGLSSESNAPVATTPVEGTGTGIVPLNSADSETIDLPTVDSQTEPTTSDTDSLESSDSTEASNTAEDSSDAEESPIAE